MTRVRPMTPFRHLYPFDRSTQMEIAYYFEFDYADGRADDSYAAAAVALARTWIASGDRGHLTLEEAGDGSVVLDDTRATIAGTPRRAELRGWKAAVYVACDRAQTLHALEALPEVRDEDVSTAELTAFLRRCTDNLLLLDNGRSWLNVAVHRPAREATAAAGLALAAAS